MPNNIINASSSGSGGLITTAADSGSLDFQSDGTTVLALTSSGATVTGTGSFSGNLSFNSGYGSSAVAYGCRAWVNFNGTGTVAIRASGNVSSITDNGTGDYTVNFTTAMPDANYCVVGMSSLNAAGTNPINLLPGVSIINVTNDYQLKSTSQVRLFNDSANDTFDTNVAIFR
jgi:hypothetical protein